MIDVSFEGIATPGAPEDRNILVLKVTFEGTVYDWQLFMPADQDIGAFIEANKSAIEADILNKQALGRPIVPTVPDYYAMRRAEYPAMGEQLDAFWKGPESQAYQDMMAQIQAVKDKYPKDWMQPYNPDEPAPPLPLP